MKRKVKLIFQIVIIIFGFISIAFISYAFYAADTDEPTFLDIDLPIKINPDEWNPDGWYA